MHVSLQRDRSEWLGYVLVFLAAALWATAGTLAKYMMLGAIPPLVLAEMRVTVASGLLVLIIVWKDRRLLRIKRRDIPYMLLLGVVGMAGVHYSYYYAISKTTIATAILLQYLGPAFIMLFAVVFQGEAFSGVKVLSLCFAFGGCFLMVGGYDLAVFDANKAGVVAGLASAGFFAFYSLYGEYGLKKYSVWTILLYGFTAASLFWWGLNPPWKVLTAGYSLETWGLFLVLGVFSVVLPFWMYFTGMRYIRATQASITAMAEPVIGGLVAYLFLGETLFALQFLGAVLVMVGILLLQVVRSPQVRAETPCEQAMSAVQPPQ
ncbi:EamA family transporter [candidate division KSB3 bacterium]|uniref:EamA family transporter n=1 Tax=candidate division KSB3 bacterium TaxID=2044937 RepID=A0A9D5Q762_9BACT|nr:EamA family transporter [candidate division KSB3 bacterium]MBD3325977.1 EamA family transporter [candidate division KSB3 bacterium]